MCWQVTTSHNMRVLEYQYWYSWHTIPHGRIMLLRFIITWHLWCETNWNCVEISTSRLTNIEQHAVYKIPVVLCGNKCDQEDKRQIPLNVGLRLSDKLGKRLYTHALYAVYVAGLEFVRSAVAGGGGSVTFLTCHLLAQLLLTYPPSTTLSVDMSIFGCDMELWHWQFPTFSSNWRLPIIYRCLVMQMICKAFSKYM